MSSASTGGTEGSSPASSPASAASLAMAAPKYGTLVPNRIFVGGISASTSEAELAQLFSGYGNVKATKIIADRAGVSKGYGFVTFETEEEAKRPQQESESIILRERKLNIAPAIKKQPFSRSFDGGTGSPPAVPSNTYYYPNGMGLTYQNGMTFYNTGAPAPPTPVAPPTDPATIYQATSIFGPQATAGHQTFAPVMYPCPAPSLYVPQQYQYSPMPYEQYYTGAASTGTPSYLYSTSNSQNSSNTGGNGSGGGSNGTGAASLPAGSLPPLASLPVPQPAHYYAPAAPTPHHHPPVPTGPPPPQMDHLYYSFTTGPPPSHPPHTSIGLADQQLLLYTTDASCQPSQCDGQSSTQEESRSTSSHSDQLHGETPSAQVSGSATPLVPLVPLKFPMSSRYTNYHPIAIHATNLHGSQTCLSDSATDETNVNQMHCRTIVYHPTTVYIPHSHASPYHQAGTGGSLLPTPPPSSRNAVQSGPKIHNNPINRDYSKAVAVANAQNNFVKSQNLSIALISSSTSFSKNHNINVQAPNKYAGTELTHKFTANVSSSNRYPVQQYANKRGSSSNLSSTYFHSQKTHYGNVNYQKPANFGMNVAHSFGQPSYHQKSGNFHNSGQSLDYANGRRLSNYGSDQYPDSTNSRSKNTISNYKSGTNCSVNQQQSDGYSNSEHYNHSGNQSNAKNATGCANKQIQRSNVANNVVDKSVSPPPAPYSPMTRPLPTLSPPIPQVQFYASPAQNRYQSVMHPSQTSGHQQPGQRRYTAAPPLPAGRKASEKYLTSSNSGSSTMRQAKYKPNGLMQPAGKVSDENIGGAGDAPPGVGRMPITPPGTPQNHTGAVPGDQNQSSDPCHQMQTLAL